MAERIILEAQDADPVLEEHIDQELGTQVGESQPANWIKLAGAASVLLFLLIYLLRLDPIVGLFGDDAWYVLLAKSLATGHGYTLINSPSPGIMPFYPPAFPFLLSLVFRLAPQFPQNVWLLKSVSMVAMLGAGTLAYRYFRRDREVPAYVALGIAAASVLNPVMAFLATSTVMSECVFTLNLLLAVVVIERGVRASKSGQAVWLYAALGAVLASFAFLTRSIAVGLIVAVFVYLLKERLMRAALIFAAVVTMLIGPWMIYTRSHTPTDEQRREQGGYIVQPYTAQFWQRQAGNASSGTVSVEDLPARAVNNVIAITGRDAAHLLAPPIFELLRDAFQEAQKAGAQEGMLGDTLFFSFLLTALVIAGFISVAREKITLAEIAVPFMLGVTVLWPFETFRFVLPLLPFVVFYFLMGCRAIHRLHQRLRQISRPHAPWITAGVMAACVLVVSLYGNGQYLFKRYAGSALAGPQLLSIFDETAAMCRWIDQELPKDGVIATPNPPLVYLYTGRKTVAQDNPAGNWENWKRLKVGYLARLSVYETGVDPAESRYRVIYRARGNDNLRVIDLGDPATRLPWGASASGPMRVQSVR